MCSEFITIKRMEQQNDHQGDLTDMLRGYAGDWQFVSNPVNYLSQEFGDPFTQITDPLIIHDDIDPPPPFMNVDQSSGGAIFSSTPPTSDAIVVLENDHDEMKIRPSNNIFSRMLQISTTAKLQLPARESPAVIMATVGASPIRGLVPNNDHRYGNLISSSPNSSKSCLVNEIIPAGGGVQISSPRNTGIKRRKGQAKKVVCVPAPAPANSRPGGEVVPSDLWAWRKYGQKPIKGSPYPRGYYRCSSSKGCSARKQVERSRTDPNMLVITYTSEHNHPWPTQRNALAGSTRTHQPTKTSTNTSRFSQKQPDPKEEPSTENRSVDPNPTVVKLERDKDFDMNDDVGFGQSYKPVFLESSNQSEDSFFADLGEIEPDPLDLLFAQGFSGGDDPENKDLDPFTFYDWAGTNGCSATTSSAAAATCGEAKRDS